MKIIQIVFLWLLITGFGVLNTSSNHINFAKSNKSKIDRVPANEKIEIIKEKDEAK
jgi:hypothetical protein